MGQRILKNWKLRLLVCILMGGVVSETGYLITRIQINAIFIGITIYFLVTILYNYIMSRP